MSWKCQKCLKYAFIGKGEKLETSAWPIGNDEININPDNAYASNLDGRGVTLVLHCGPSFPLSFPLPVFSHVHLHYHPALSPLHQCPKLHDWLTPQYLELLIHNHRSVALAQFITWNGYREWAQYMGRSLGHRCEWMGLTMQACTSGSYLSQGMEFNFGWG